MTAGDINPQSMSYGYDRIRFIKPVFIGDTITVTAEISEKADHPKRPEQFGYLHELVTVTNQRAETVMVLTHLYQVKKRARTSVATRPRQYTGRMATLSEVAALAGVSISAVSRVLSNAPSARVRPETQAAHPRRGRAARLSPQLCGPCPQVVAHQCRRPRRSRPDQRDLHRAHARGRGGGAASRLHGAARAHRGHARGRGVDSAAGRGGPSRRRAGADRRQHATRGSEGAVERARAGGAHQLDATRAGSARSRSTTNSARASLPSTCSHLVTPESRCSTVCRRPTLPSAASSASSLR